MSKTKWYQKPIYLMFALALVLSLSLVAAVPAGATPDATFTIGDISVLPGGTITVPVMALDVDSSYEVCQAGIDLQYDPSVVIVTNVIKGDIPSGSFIFDWEIFTNNVATYQMDFSNVYEGDIIIAYVTFQAFVTYAAQFGQLYSNMHPGYPKPTPHPFGLGQGNRHA